MCARFKIQSSPHTSITGIEIEQSAFNNKIRVKINADNIIFKNIGKLTAGVHMDVPLQLALQFSLFFDDILMGWISNPHQQN